MQQASIVIIGAGNLATNLALALIEVGHVISQVYSRSEESASVLAQKCASTYTTNINDIFSQADSYIYAVKDDALPEIIQSVSVHSGLHLHTAGSVDMSVFSGSKASYGVLYPLQTFTKNKPVKFDNIPIFVEANTENGLQKLHQLANSLSNEIIDCDSTQRFAFHLAAVFSCNFSNYMHQVAARILAENNLDFKLLLPLITESVAKLQQLTPAEAQTGPAIRQDKVTMNKHLLLLSEKPEEYNLYQLLSNSISRKNKL